MAQTCTICTHARRVDINRSLVDGSPVRELAKRFGVSKSALQRHKDDHLSKVILGNAEARKKLEGLSVVERAEQLYEQTQGILEAATAANEPGLALKAIQRLERQLELVGRLLGEIRDIGPTVNVLIAPEWLALRSAVIGALDEYPEARGAVLRGLQEAGDQNGNA
jgi:hypothetical protein